MDAGLEGLEDCLDGEGWRKARVVRGDGRAVFAESWGEDLQEIVVGEVEGVLGRIIGVVRV